MFSLGRRAAFNVVLGLSLGMIATALVAIAITVLALRNDAVSEAKRDTQNIATVLAEQTDRAVQAIDIAMTEIAERFSNPDSLPSGEYGQKLRSLDTHQYLKERLKGLQQTDFFALIDNNGQITATSRSWPSNGHNLSDRDYFAAASRDSKPNLYVSNVVRNRIDGRHNLFFTKRINAPNGEFLGIVFAGVKPSYFEHVYRSITSVRGQSFVLLRDNGTILVRYPDPQGLTGQLVPNSSDWHRLIKDGGGTMTTKGALDGVPRLIAVRPLRDFPLVVNVVVPTAEVLAAWRHRALVIGIGSMLALICSLLLVYALYRQFARLVTSEESLIEREATLAQRSHELEQANLRVDRAVNNMGHGLCMFNARQELLVCNQTYLELYGFSAVQVKPGTTFRRILDLRVANGSFKDDIDGCIQEMTVKMRAGEELVLTMDVGGGRVYCVTNHPTEDGGWVSTHEDITARIHDERELQRARNTLRAVVENIPEMLVVKDARTGRYVFINRTGQDMLGIERQDWVGRSTHEVFSPKQADRIVACDREAIESGKVEIHNSVVETKAGSVHDIISKRVAINGKDGKPEYLINLIEDITERKRNEVRIHHLAHHDPLTDLPNRTVLDQHLATTLERCAASGEKFAVVCIDLDRFKEVNDLYGHAAGDSVLLDISNRMRHACQGAFLARAGGDEFVAICAEGAQPAAATALAQRLIESTMGDIECEGRKARVGMSIGVAIYPDDGSDSVTLIRNADAALYRAKAAGRNAIRLFEPDMDRALHDRRSLQADLALAVSRNELQLYYQPQAQVSGRVIGFEALLRWDHLRRGFVPPAKFIPLAEETGLIDAIGDWVLREACREAASWHEPLQIAVNLSPIQLRQPDLASTIQAILLDTGLSPQRLVIEITEGALMDDYTRAVSILRRIKALGVRIAMDDFGTGYSSLSYLQSFPFDKIKIDKTFISNLDRNAQSAAIVRSVLGLGRSLCLTTVAEGVEDPQQLVILRREGCDEMQGYLIGRPQPICEYADIVGGVGKRAVSA